MSLLPLKNHHKGMLWIIFSVFCLTISNAVIKGTAGRYPVNEILFFRFLVAMIPSAMLLYHFEKSKGFCIKEPMFQTIRSLFGTLGLGIMFYSFGHMPLADSIAISLSVTLFSVVFSIPILKERPTKKHFLAILFGFVGVLFIAKPTGNVWSLAALCGILGAAMDAITLTTGRKLALRNVSPEQTSFFFCIGAVLLSALSLPFSGIMPEGNDWYTLFFMGLAGGIGQYCLNKGFAMAPAAVAGPMIYTASVWSVLFGYIFWSEIPVLTTIMGTSMIIVGGLYIAYLQSNSKTSIH